MIHLLQEGAGGYVGTPADAGVEGAVINLVLWLKLAVEATGAAVIGVGVVTVLYKFARARPTAAPHTSRYNEIRLTLARFLALALEFQLGADILSTAVAPTWEQIGKLGAIAVIRTALNYFLTREMRDERERAADLPAAETAPRAPGD